MKRSAALATAGLMGVALAAPLGPPGRRVEFIDLGPKANQTLTDRFGRVEGNNLASLPTGRQTFAGVTFNVEPGILKLASPRLPERKADRNDGVAVNRTAPR